MRSITVDKARAMPIAIAALVSKQLLPALNGGSPELMDDDKSFIALVQTSVNYGGITIGQLSQKVGLGASVIEGIVTATDRVPDLSFTKDGRKRIFAAIGELLQERVPKTH